MLGLIDTPDPRYRPEPEPERRPRRPPHMRLWLTLGGCIACFLLAGLMPPLVAYVLAIAGMALFFDGATSLLPSGDGLSKYKQ
jgi:hypothetical protein